MSYIEQAYQEKHADVRLLTDVKTNKSFKFHSWADWEPVKMILAFTQTGEEAKIPEAKMFTYKFWSVNLK